MSSSKFIAFAAGAGLLVGAATAAVAQSSTAPQGAGPSMGTQDEQRGTAPPSNVGNSPQDHQTGQRNTLSNTGEAPRAGVANPGRAGPQSSDDKKPGHN